MEESQENHLSNHLDEIVAAVSITPRNKTQSSLPQTLLFQAPREKLQICEEKARACSSSGEYRQAVHELVRCVALTRICYGDSHWKLAEAYVNLAQGYLQLKGLSLQAKQHVDKAKDILATSFEPPYDDNTDVFKCSVELFHTTGRALLSLKKFDEATENLEKAERLSKELLQSGRIIKEEWVESQARIKWSIAQVYQGQKKLKEALLHYQEALEYTESSKGENSLGCVPLLRELAGVEQALGLHEAAISHLSQAHLIVLGEDLPQEETADSAHFVAHAAAASRKPVFQEVAEQHFEECMSRLKDCNDSARAKFLSVQDEFCHFLQIIGQKERAMAILRESLEAKVSLFGDFSPEVAETYRLLGSADLEQGKHRVAHKALKKQQLHPWSFDWVAGIRQPVVSLDVPSCNNTARRGPTGLKNRKARTTKPTAGVNYPVGRPVFRASVGCGGGSRIGDLCWLQMEISTARAHVILPLDLRTSTIPSICFQRKG
ncbi:tetratricopeptide repeat protein 23 isoform X2 [Ochotona princeps]|nr:tetratricopeptide repeat protein 23 isoform X2 [Ochotona princeps]